MTSTINNNINLKEGGKTGSNVSTLHLLFLCTGYSTIEKAYEINKFGKILDWINVMAYDLHGKWEKQTGHHSALEGIPGDNLTLTYAVDYWIGHGMSPSKIALGLAAYGRTFKFTNPRDNGSGAAASGDPPAGVHK